MSISKLELYETGTATLLTAATLDIVAGTPTASPIAFDLWNTKGDALGETARNIRLMVYERRTGETEWRQDRDVTASRWLELRVTAAGGDAVPYTTGWTPVGLSRPFPVNEIPADSFRTLELRANVPPSGENDAIEVLLRVIWDQPATALGSGFYAGGLQGIVSGVGDATRSFLVSGGAIAPTGTPDDEIHLGDLEWIAAGELKVKLAHAVALDGDALDGALASGEAYWATLSLGAGAGVTVTKSNKGAAPLPIGDRAEVPAGEVLLGWVHRDFDAAIAAGDIFATATLGSFAVYGTSGLIYDMGPGVALVDDRLVQRDQPTPVTLPAGETGIRIYLLPNGLVQATVGPPDDARALLLYEADTDPTDVLELRDRRIFLRRRETRLSFRWDVELAVDLLSYRTLAVESEAVLTYPQPALLSLDDAGSSTGQTVADVEFWDGDSWESIWPSSGTTDRRPTIAVGDLSAAGLPEARIFPKNTRFRARIVEVPTGGTPPAGGELILVFEVP